MLALEEKIYRISGLEFVAKCTEEANCEISPLCKSEYNGPEVAWKKIIHNFNTVMTAKSSKLRDMLIDAIAVARTGHLNKVVKDLRSSLKLYRIGAAGAMKAAALHVLENHGGYRPPEGAANLSFDDDDASDIASVSLDDTSVATMEGHKASDLGADALALWGSLHGNDDADREDWRNAVNDCTTIAR